MRLAFCLGLVAAGMFWMASPAQGFWWCHHHKHRPYVVVNVGQPQANFGYAPYGSYGSYGAGCYGSGGYGSGSCYGSGGCYGAPAPIPDKKCKEATMRIEKKVDALIASLKDKSNGAAVTSAPGDKQQVASDATGDLEALTRQWQARRAATASATPTNAPNPAKKAEPVSGPRPPNPDRIVGR